MQMDEITAADALLPSSDVYMCMYVNAGWLADALAVKMFGLCIYKQRVSVMHIKLLLLNADCRL